MNKFSNDPFTSKYPSLDLHGETRDTMIHPLKDFLNDNIKLKNRNVAIIHGIGLGILKKTTHLILNKDKRVKSYYVSMYNPGCTIVELKIDKH